MVRGKVPVLEFSICFGSKHVGDFSRSADGKCALRPKGRLSGPESRVLEIYGTVLSDIVGGSGDLPSEARVARAAATLGVPLNLMVPLYCWPDALLSVALGVTEGMISLRREMLMARRPGSVPARLLGGGDA